MSLKDHDDRRDGDGAMALARFRDLADIYGANTARWPALEQDAARRCLAKHPEAVHVLDMAAHLDDVLASHTIVPAQIALYRRIAASAPKVRPLFDKTRLWWSGLTGVALAGALSGALAVSLALPSLKALEERHVAPVSRDAILFGDVFNEQDAEHQETE